MAAPIESVTRGDERTIVEPFGADFANTPPPELALQVLAPGAETHIAGWERALVADVVSRLKDGADQYWLINPNRSVEMAEAIIRIGEIWDDANAKALGIMARADALKLLGHAHEAWEAFQEAGRLFQGAQNEVGWARTRIGPLFLSVGLNRVEEALKDALIARAILEAHHENDLLGRLTINTAIVYYERGDHASALQLYSAAQAAAEPAESGTHQFLGLIYANIGLVYCDLMGDYRLALEYFERARALAAARGDTKNIAIANMDIARVMMEQGHYKRALPVLYDARELLQAEGLTHDATTVERIIVECYLQLNRYAEARELATAVVGVYQTSGDVLKQAESLVNLAAAEAWLGRWAAAEETLGVATERFDECGAAIWAAITRLWRGVIAQKRGDAHSASVAAREAFARFANAGHAVYLASALLLQAETSAEDDGEAASHLALRALGLARTSKHPGLRYGAHLTLGKIAETRGDLVWAARHYRAANALVERIQRGLSLTLRPTFLVDKGEALQRLIALRIRAGDARQAFLALELSRSQELLRSITQSQTFRWNSSDAETVRLIDELAGLRDRHRWLFRLAHEDASPDHERPTTLTPHDARTQLVECERAMRAVTERLYLVTGDDAPSARQDTPSIESIQGALDEESVLLEFSMGDANINVFALDSHSIMLHALTAPLATVERLIAQFQLNVAATLAQGAASAAVGTLRLSAERYLEQLYAALLAPLEGVLHGKRRLYIVPSGKLHYLPFHLLRSNGRYLIEDYEVVVLPAAGLLARTAPARSPGARVIAHSANGFLPQVVAEAEMVSDLFGGESLVEEAANRLAFGAEPTQILHLAAHAAFRLDAADLSYIELADGQLYADDLMQQDLSYELVVLSACETGRAQVAARDELIGLGRGFLYAGAGSLIASLWRVGDEIALPLMRHFYEALRGGASKAAALRMAQEAILTSHPHLHPAFWGPFQLIGDAGVLSTAGRGG